MATRALIARPTWSWRGSLSSIPSWSPVICQISIASVLSTKPALVRQEVDPRSRAARLRQISARPHALEAWLKRAFIGGRCGAERVVSESDPSGSGDVLRDRMHECDIDLRACGVCRIADQRFDLCRQHLASSKGGGRSPVTRNEARSRMFIDEASRPFADALYRDKHRLSTLFAYGAGHGRCPPRF
jgi:hypothetical protein